jgi:hypothetical protein
MAAEGDSIEPKTGAVDRRRRRRLKAQITSRNCSALRVIPVDRKRRILSLDKGATKLLKTVLPVVCFVHKSSCFGRCYTQLVQHSHVISLAQSAVKAIKLATVHSPLGTVPVKRLLDTSTN